MQEQRNETPLLDEFAAFKLHCKILVTKYAALRELICKKKAIPVTGREGSYGVRR
jgi:hypothetical protein